MIGQARSTKHHVFCADALLHVHCGRPVLNSYIIIFMIFYRYYGQIARGTAAAVQCVFSSCRRRHRAHLNRIDDAANRRGHGDIGYNNNITSAIPRGRLRMATAHGGPVRCPLGALRKRHPLWHRQPSRTTRERVRKAARGQVAQCERTRTRRCLSHTRANTSDTW